MCDSVLDGVCLCMICCDDDDDSGAADDVVDDDDCGCVDGIGCCVGLCCDVWVLMCA